MKCTSVLVSALAVLACASYASAQPCHHSGFLAPRGDTNVVSRSFTQSFSWFHGSDGQMHSQSQETHNDLVQNGANMKRTQSQSFSWFHGSDGQMHSQSQETHNDLVQNGANMKRTQSQVVCQDGHCEEVMMVAVRPTVQEVTMYGRPMDGFEHMLNSILSQMDPQQLQTEILVLPVSNGVVAGQEDHLKPQENYPRVEVEDLNSETSAWGAIEKKFHDKSPTSGDIEMTPSNHLRNAKDPPRDGRDPKARAHWRELTFITFGTASFAVAIAFLAVLAITKCHRSSASERSLHALAEPLMTDSDEDVVKCLRPAKDHKLSSIAAYLAGVYARADAKSESASVRKYMSRLYTRILR